MPVVRHHSQLATRVTALMETMMDDIIVDAADEAVEMDDLESLIGMLDQLLAVSSLDDLVAFACAEGAVKVVSHILDKEMVGVNHRIHGRSLIDRTASVPNNANLVATLLERGARVNDEALIIPCKNGDLETVKLLLPHVSSVDAGVPGGPTALGAARQFGHKEIERLLLQRGATKEVA